MTKYTFRHNSNSDTVELRMKNGKPHFVVDADNYLLASTYLLEHFKMTFRRTKMGMHIYQADQASDMVKTQN